MLRVKKGRKEKESKRSERRSKARQTLVKFRKWLFLLLLLEQNWLCVSAGAEGLQRRTEAMVRMQQEVRMGGGDSTKVEAAKREDRTEKKKEAGVRCSMDRPGAQRRST